jgi:predicted RND superfamily exporter protein
MVRTLYLRLYDRVFTRPPLVLFVVSAVAGASAWFVPSIGLDMSFRPLFGQDQDELEATRRFEERFGQRSGAYIGAIVTPDAWTPEFVQALAGASEEVTELSHVSEVISLTRTATARWYPDSARGEWIIEPEGLDSILSESEFYTALAVRDELSLGRTVVSAGGARTMLLARVALPLEDLERRAGVIREFQAVVDRHLSRVAHRRWIGISVVEEAYSRLVLTGLAWSLALTTLVLLLVLLAVFRRPAAVLVVMAGVSLALPFSLAVMVARGQAITIVNSMVPTMIMIIGVADAIHMFESFGGHLRGGMTKSSAVRAMFGDMALPCLLTALTTIAGLLALETARIGALRDFGLNVAVGILAVYVLNLLALPALLRVLPEARLLPERPRNSPLEAWRRSTADLLTRRPEWVAGSSAALILVCAAGAQRINVDQRFNEDVSADHPIRVSQAIYESEFTGLLGPDVTVQRADGASVLGRDDRRRLAGFVEGLRDLSGVIHVESVLDHLPDSVPGERASPGVLSLRSDSRIGERVRDVIDEDGRQTAVLVRTADVGSREALALVQRIERLAEQELGSVYEIEIVGQWWLAQLGLSNILRDMLVSFATSFALVLPLLALTLGSVRLFVAGVVPNLLPMFFALGFMGWAGISVRVGTAMILAIALAIAVDDTIHVLVRLKYASRESAKPEDHVRSAIEHAGGPVLLTTLVLVAGFLSMRVNGLVAIQDMGLVAAATLTVAMLTDVYFLPASYLILSRFMPPSEARRSLSSRAPRLSGLAPPTTSIDV